jgi:fumarate hydratase subunit alpha
MRLISVTEITEAIASLFQEACYHLPEDVLAALRKARNLEDSPVACDVLDRLLENAALAARGQIPLCQDTGTAVVFVELGQDIHISGGDFYDAISEGVRRGYDRGYLRKSMVQHPYSDRINTRDNTPPVIHLNIVPGDRLKIIAMPKGGGGENMTRLGMLVPASGRQGIIDFVVKTVAEAGANSCPPVIIGVGIGGTPEKVVLLAKEALLREVGLANPETEHAELEREILEQVNHLGIGAMGYGGRITALAVHIEVFPCHIGCLPVAVNLQCHSARHKEAIL